MKILKTLFANSMEQLRLFLPIFMLLLTFDFVYRLSSFILDLTVWQIAVDLSVMVLCMVFPALFCSVVAGAAVTLFPKLSTPIKFIVNFCALSLVMLAFLNCLWQWIKAVYGINTGMGTGLKLAVVAAALGIAPFLMCSKTTGKLRLKIGQAMTRFHLISKSAVLAAFLFTVVSLSLFLMRQPVEEKVVSRKAEPSNAIPKIKNVLLVTFDSLAARDMSLYGYHLPTTPNIDAWAKEPNSFVFDHFYAQSNWTCPTTTSLIASVYPSIHKIFNTLVVKRKLLNPTQTFSSLLKDQKINTIALVRNVGYANPKQNGTSSGFNITDAETNMKTSPKIILNSLHITEYTNSWSSIRDLLGFRTMIEDMLGHEVGLFFNDQISPTTDLALKFSAMSPFFMWLHLWPPHAPYLPPAPHYGIFSNSDKSTIENSDTEKLNSSRNRYDEFIHYCDAEFGRFIEQLKEKGLYDSTLIILSADHGESFEDNYGGHGGPFLYNQVINIPCVIHCPGLNGGVRIKANAEQVDLSPTILDILGIEKPQWMSGESLLPYMKGQKQQTQKPKYSMQLDGNSRFSDTFTKGTVAVMLDNWKLIYDIAKDKAELYNLDADPQEDNDVAASNTQRVKEMKSLIQRDILSGTMAGRK